MSKLFRPEEISPHHGACRHCSAPQEHEPPHFVFGVDLDGVCADFYAGLRPIAAEWLGRELETLTPNPSFNVPEWDLPTNQGGYPELHRFAVNRKKLFETLPPMEGAPQALRELSFLCIRIRIITHRFYISRSHELAASQTVRWLEEQDIPYWDLCFMRDKEAVECDAYVDDNAGNVARVQERFARCTRKVKPQAILFEPKGGQRPSGTLLARNWAELSAQVQECFKEWQVDQAGTARR
jgi:hypothetical protein